jgi:hypothetical protein
MELAELLRVTTRYDFCFAAPVRRANLVNNDRLTSFCASTASGGLRRLPSHHPFVQRPFKIRRVDAFP